VVLSSPTPVKVSSEIKVLGLQGMVSSTAPPSMTLNKVKDDMEDRIDSLVDGLRETLLAQVGE
jgi:hypothetical protein